MASDVRFISKRMRVEYIQGKGEFNIEDISRVTLVGTVVFFFFRV